MESIMSNGGALDLILTVVTLVSGIMILTGHGDIFLKGGNADVRQKKYDEKKVQKASGILLIMFGVLSALNMFIASTVYEIIYVVLVVVMVIGFTYYVRVKCKK